MRTSKRLLLAIGLPLALAAPALAGDLERSFPAAASGTVYIALDLGSIDVQPSDGDQIRIEASARGVGASSVHFAAYAEGPDVRFRGTAERWVEWLRSAPGVRVRAWVPEGYEVRVAPGDRVELAGTGVAALR